MPQSRPRWNAGQPGNDEDSLGADRLAMPGSRSSDSDLSVVFPKRMTVRVDPSAPATLSPQERDALDRDPVVIANRRKLNRLHELRANEPVDVDDALHGASWMLFLFLAPTAAFRVAIDLQIVWAAAAAFVLELALLVAFVSELERRERHLLRDCGHRIADPRPRPEFHWRLMTPGSVVRRVRAHVSDEFAAINVDDSELEDDLDRLYRHGADNYDFRATPNGRRRTA